MLSNIPTHVITGFLGSGKTTLILHLLKSKPASERWAVLVNEFGKIGVDGALLQGQQAKDRGVFVAEVPGGCMGCTTALPMQVALNRLLSDSRPHRLLVEPSGLGHPAEVCQRLSTDAFSEVLSLQKVTTVVDARKIADARYATHPLFQQQLEIADLIIANKQDLSSNADRQALQSYVKSRKNGGVEILWTEQGQVALDMLTGNRTTVPDITKPHPSESVSQFKSEGLRISPEEVFGLKSLESFLRSLNVERLKAVCITDDGIYAYNMAEGCLNRWPLDEALETRIEIIGEKLPADWKSEILSLLQ